MFAQLPGREEPVTVETQQSLLRPKMPAVTTFNKKMVAVICLILGAVLLVAVVSIMQPRKKVSSEAVNQQRDASGKSQLNEALTPAAMNKVPGSYSGHDFSGVKPNMPAPVFPVEEPVRPKDVNLNQQLSPQEQAAIEARKSPIRFIGLDQQSQSSSQTKQVDSSNGAGNLNNLNAGLLPEMPGAQTSSDQDEKQAFLNANSTSTNFYTSAMGLRSPLSKFEVKAGSVIPVTLLTGINSDLPGYITAQVRENVYDTVTGRFLLIPQGTRVIGVYDSKIAYAQNRLLVAWSRLILPNGQSLALEGMVGTDAGGYAGFKDKVNNHWDKIIAGGLMTSLLGAGSKMLSSTDTTSSTTSYEDLAAAGAAQSLAEAGSKIFEKNLEIQPTLEIRPGLKFNVFVNKDLILESYGKQ
jgi:type IV secretory pathway VirB10-like protein